jgi:hypothetical protein
VRRHDRERYAPPVDAGTATVPPAAVFRSTRRTEAWIALVLAAVLSLAMAGLPGVDSAAHLYQTGAFQHFGWRIWNNYWYAGRYELINYSVLFYPVAATVGAFALALASVVSSAALFAWLVVGQWGRPARWSARIFAATWPFVLLAGQYPFALGAAFALAALCLLQRDRLWLGVASAALCLLASPLAFLLLAASVGGFLITERDRSWLRRRRTLAPLIVVLLLGASEFVIVRAFPSGGSFPYPILDLFGITAFSVAGWLFARGTERTRPLAGLFVAFLILGWTAKVFPSALGGNATRILDYISAPLLALVIALRGYRPRVLAVIALGVALVWQAAPAVRNAIGISAERASAATFWRTPIHFFDVPAHRDRNFRVEVVATWGHWESLYLAGRGIPLVRGWFRQDDFPQNRLFYGSRIDASSYQAWLRATGVRYVLLPRDELDPSARLEAALLRSGHSGLRPIETRARWAIYELPHATPILTPPPGASPTTRAGTQVLRLSGDSVVVWAPVRGQYRLRVRYTPYWRVDDPAAACVQAGSDGMSQLWVERPGPVKIDFTFSLGRAASTVDGSGGDSCQAAFPPVRPAR